MRLSAENITIERGGRRVLANLSFEIESGEALVVLGPNGAGKTSLLRAIAGLLPIASGSLSLDEVEEEAPLGELTHYVGHADALKGALTARENLEFWAAALGPPAAIGARARDGAMRRLAPAALDRFGLGGIADFPVHALSAGQKRRVALARVLVAERPLWLLDEPMSALDQAAQGRFSEIMRERLSAGGLIVAATHAPLGIWTRGRAQARGGRGGGGVREALALTPDPSLKGEQL